MTTDVESTAGATRDGQVTRIVGIDLARCLAIVGMLAAHVGYVASGDDGGGWVTPFNGRSAALFATLAGVSLAIITRRSDERPLGWRYARFAIATRGVLLLLIGYALVLLDTPIEVILPAYGAMFLMVLPALRLPPAALAGLAALVIVVAPVVVLGLQQWWVGEIYPDTELAAWDPLLTGTYPAITWIGYLLAGLVIGRMALRPALGAWVLVAGGSALAVVGYGAGLLLSGSSDADTGAWPGVLLSVEPHGDTTFEVAGNLGVAAAVLGLCLLVTRLRPARLLLAPLLAAGSMSLSIYTAQIIVIRVLGDDIVYEPASNVPFLTLVVGSILAAWAWRSFWGRGPLERVVAQISTGIAQESIGMRAPGAVQASAGHDGRDADPRSDP